MPQPTAAAFQRPNKVRCPKCMKPLKVAPTFRTDGNLLTCENKVVAEGENIDQHWMKQCGAKIYLLVGPGFVTTALLSPEQFRELQARPDCGDPLKVLEWLGLANTPLMPAA